jgi:ComF family protein
MFREIFSLFYPSLCAACREPLLQNEHTICTSCWMDLPYTGYFRDKDNPVERLFWGRSPVHFATSLCHFRKAGRVQRLLHELKYKGRTEVGHILGVELGRQIRESPHFGQIDAIAPVPLHPRKERQRGYNQSLFIAEGISSVLQAPVQPALITRTIHTSTQTRRSRYDRYRNVEQVFQVNEPPEGYGNHVLIVDDVVTTGSTLEACCNSLREHSNPETKVSIATLAVA